MHCSLSAMVFLVLEMVQVCAAHVMPPLVSSILFHYISQIIGIDPCNRALRRKFYLNLLNLASNFLLMDHVPCTFMSDILLIFVVVVDFYRREVLVRSPYLGMEF